MKLKQDLQTCMPESLWDYSWFHQLLKILLHNWAPSPSTKGHILALLSKHWWLNCSTFALQSSELWIKFTFLRRCLCQVISLVMIDLHARIALGLQLVPSIIENIAPQLSPLPVNKGKFGKLQYCKIYQTQIILITMFYMNLKNVRNIYS
jgi:hypothetical protein